MAKKDKITIQGTESMFFSQKKEDYISLTDMAKYKNAEIPAHVISHWLSTKYTIEFMGIWETLMANAIHLLFANAPAPNKATEIDKKKE
jgi:hypothetical protein